MLLFKKAFHAGLVSGAVTVTFRRWDKPHVRAGGRYRCHPIGVLEVDTIERIRVAAISDADSARAGFATRDALVAYLAELGPIAATDEVYRVVLHHGGDGDRVELALEAALTAEDIATIRGKLARMDASSAWTQQTLAIIAANPQVAASRLAAALGRETLELKTDIRKLKKLGLTQSFEVGYEISPRGRAYMGAVPAGKRPPAVPPKPEKPPKPAKPTKRTKAAKSTKPAKKRARA